MKCIKMSIFYWFYNFFIILEIKVSQISYSLSKATPKAVENNELIGLISSLLSPLLVVPQPERAMGKPDDGCHCKHQCNHW